DWVVKRFNVPVFENELKWYSTEPQQGKVDYSVPDQMLAWCKANKIAVRGHNIFWDDENHVPAWVKQLDKEELQKAVNKRLGSVVGRYAGRFINWDVNNEMMHHSFFEDRLGPNASNDFYLEAQKLDPQTPMFVNDYNIIETNQNPKSTVDLYIRLLVKIKSSGRVLEGIGLEGHFSKPNIPYMRAVLDKLGTLGMPIFLTEVDVSSNFDQQTQNLPAGDTVDKILKEWTTNVQGITDANGSFKFNGFFGDYDFSATFNGENVTKTISVTEEVEDIHIQI
ncbi:hypothetical protein KI387_019545, partial [Taxus chinensis]